MIYVLIALTVAVLWVVSGAVSSIVSNVKLPKIKLPSLPPLPPEPAYQETPAEKYRRRLQLLDSLPLTEEERHTVAEQARKDYIREAGDAVR